MKRLLIVLIVMLAIGLQGSVAAFAGVSPSITADCQTAGGSAAPQDACCPTGHHTMSCCLDTCLGTVVGAVEIAPHALQWLGPGTLLPQFFATRFSSRGDSPLIRPPIL